MSLSLRCWDERTLHCFASSGACKYPNIVLATVNSPVGLQLEVNSTHIGMVADVYLEAVCAKLINWPDRSQLGLTFYWELSLLDTASPPSRTYLARNTTLQSFQIYNFITSASSRALTTFVTLTHHIHPRTLHMNVTHTAVQIIRKMECPIPKR